MASLRKIEIPWAIAGGWALSLFAGKQLRGHSDVEVAVFRPDQKALRDYLVGWEFQYVPHKSGHSVPWPAGLLLELPLHEIHATSPTGDHLEILLNERDGHDWVFRKNPSVRLPLEKAILATPSGLPALAPEIVLLYKALTSERRPKDEADFQAILPLLSAGQKYWLERSLAACQPGHPWLDSLPSIKADLQRAYDLNAATRDRVERADWKRAERANFLDHLRGAGSRSLLEIGAGPGRDSLFFKRMGLAVTATDLSPEMVRLCRQKGLDAYVRDFYDLGFAQDSFDAVWALNCLLHVPSADLAVVLAGIHAVLAPGGLFFFGVYGGIDREGVWEHDQNQPQRWFTFYTDERLQAAVRPFFEVVSFKAIDLEEDSSLHFQALVCKKAIGRNEQFGWVVVET